MSRVPLGLFGILVSLLLACLCLREYRVELLLLPVQKVLIRLRENE